MIINRNNYEEVFLMYVDGELNTNQRTEVENFVQQNPDLLKELDMLKQTVLPVDEMRFDEKTILYKTIHTINSSNYLEYFLLYVDNELSNEEKQDVEKFVLQHPHLQSEFVLLQQTKLAADEVVFADKKILYRSTERRVVPMAWLRMAVAAAVIGLVGALWFASSNSGGIKSPENAFVADQKKPAIIEKIKDTDQPKDDVTEAAVNKDRATFAKAAHPLQKQIKAANNIATNVMSKSAGSVNNDNDVVPNKDISQIIAANKITPTPKDEAGKIRTESTTPETNTNTNTFVANNNNHDEQSVTHAVYLAAEPEDNNSFYIGSAEINKTKLRSLFKKAATLFDKKPDNNKEERIIRIASFELKSK